MSARMKQGLISLALVVVLGVAGVAEACCGAPPTYFVTVSVVGTPDCDNGHGTGIVQWKVSYHLPTAHNMFVTEYGDGVIQDTDYYTELPHTPGYQVDVMTGSSTWQWQPFTTNPRKVRVEFYVDYGPGLVNEQRALIVFDCTAQGPKNVSVYND